MNNTSKILSLQAPHFDNSYQNFNHIPPNLSNISPMPNGDFGMGEIPDFAEKIPFIDDPKMGGKSSGACSLGNITKSQSNIFKKVTTQTKNNLSPTQKRQKKRQHQYSLLNTAQNILHGGRVCSCCSARVDSAENVKIKLKTTQIGNQKTIEASYLNVLMCSDLWVCPVCNKIIMSQRHAEIRMAKQKFEKNGGHVNMWTFTHSHIRKENLILKVKRINFAFSRFFGDREMKEFFRIIEKIGHIKNLEVTHGEANGWHPHNHMLVFSHLPKDQYFAEIIPVFTPHSDAPLDAPYRLATDKRVAKAKDVLFNKIKKSNKKAINKLTDKELLAQADREIELSISYVTPENFAKRWWIKVCVAVGLGRPNLEHGLTISGGDVVDNYLTDTNYGEDLAFEMTNSQGKKAKQSSFNQWEILYLADKDPYYASLFAEYAQAFKGQKQLVWSRGLKKMFKIDEISDEELAQKELENDDEVIETIDELEIDYPYWQRIRYWKLQAKILDMAEDYGLEYVKKYLPTIKELPEKYTERIKERPISLKQMINKMLNEPVLKPAIAPCELEKVI